MNIKKTTRRKPKQVKFNAKQTLKKLRKEVIDILQSNVTHKMQHNATIY